MPVSPPNSAATIPRESGTLNAKTRGADVVAALVYSVAALAALVYFRLYYFWISDPWSSNWPLIALGVAAALLAVAAIRVFAGRGFGDVAALIGALLAWPQFRWITFNRWAPSPWLAFNMPGNRSDLHRVFFFAWLQIVLASVLAAATSWSLLRLTPEAWRLRNLPVRNRIWPGFAATLLFVLVWYGTAVTRYKIPILDLHSIPPRILVLHVEKHGLQFDETNLAVYRDGRVYIAHERRRLFEYSFQRTWSMGGVPERDFGLIASLPDSPPTFVGSNVADYDPPRAWNANRWFVYLPSGRQPIIMNVSVMPKSVLDLFSDSLTTAPYRVWQETRRDICFGFCFDPTY